MAALWREVSSTNALESPITDQLTISTSVSSIGCLLTIPTLLLRVLVECVRRQWHTGQWHTGTESSASRRRVTSLSAHQRPDAQTMVMTMSDAIATNSLAAKPRPIDND
jgi:hypothetical protein